MKKKLIKPPLRGRLQPTQGAQNKQRFSSIIFHQNWLWALLLLVVTLIAYYPALNGKFVWDDDSWTTDIVGLFRNFKGLYEIWFNPVALQQYYPFTATSFWVDYHLWHFWTLPYHVENVLLHVLAAILFWNLLKRLSVPGAWLAAAIFALHPVMVESAAWITERKNVLSLVCYLGALLAYGRFAGFWEKNDNRAVDSGKTRASQHWPAYILALVLSLCALLAKTTAVSLPAVILLICWWKRGRIEWRRDVLPVLPIFGFAFGLGLVTAWLEKNHLGTEGSAWNISFAERCLIAGHVPWFYAGKLLWPANLCFLYPRWQLDVHSLKDWIYPLGIVGTLIVLWLWRGRIGRGPAAAAFFFVGTLFPVLGFLNTYFFRFSFVCDHWTYLSSLGLIALAGAGLARVADFLRAPKVLYGVAIILLSCLGILTRHQSGMYKNMATLWQTTIKENPDAWMAQNNLGAFLIHQGRVEEALPYIQKALDLKPDYVEAEYNLGVIFLLDGRLDDAVAHFEKTLQLQPDYPDAHNSLGAALVQKGQLDEAIIQFQKELEFHPDYANAHNNLGMAFLQKGQTAQAIAHFQKALEIRPDFADAYKNLAWVLATCPDASLRNGVEAVELARRADQLAHGHDPLIKAAQAAAYAEVGQFPKAMDTIQKALLLATAQNNAPLANALQAQLQSYQAKLPFRDMLLTNSTGNGSDHK